MIQWDPCALAEALQCVCLKAAGHIQAFVPSGCEGASKVAETERFCAG